MFIKDHLISEIEQTDNSTILVELFEILRLLKQHSEKLEPHPVLALVGCLSDDEANSMRKTINAEFNHIEGEW